MSTQKHIIKRQVIELKAGDPAEAQVLQAELSRIFRQRIIPLLDQCCTQASAPDRVHRIERLELDLGRIDPRRLEADLIARLSELLPAALAEQIGAHERAAAQRGPGMRAGAQLELLALFARTGCLPWWADAAQPRILDDCLEQLLAAAPEPLRRLMRDLAREQRPLRRLVCHYGDELLALLVTALAPALPYAFGRAPAVLAVALQKSSAAAGRTYAQIRQSVWLALLQLLGLEDWQPVPPEQLYRAVLRRVAADLGSPYRVLLAGIRQALRRERAPGHLTLRRAIEVLSREQARQDWSSGRLAELRVLARRLPQPLQGQVLGALDGGRLPVEAAGRVIDLLQLALSGALPVQVAGHLTELLQLILSGAVPAEASGRLSELLQLALSGRLSAEAASRLLSGTLPAEASGRLSELLKLTLSDSLLSPELRASLLAELQAVAAQEPGAPGSRHRLPELLAELQVPAVREPHAPGSMRRRRLIAASLGRLRGPRAPGFRHRKQPLPASPGGLRGLRAPDHNRSPVNRQHDGRSEPARPPARTPEPAGITPADGALDLSFSDADELHIGNAGLVILWPFLGHFFAHLDLLDDRRFRDLAATQRAAGLLQHIATGEAAFPEYLLPLTKLLCGMALAEVFDFGAPVAEAEAQECHNLLTAVIAQAPILHDMSVPGFRGSFLLRPGLLRARDGAWLLQVERETYDIVLERFPWGWEWVRLPWMEAPLRVEWL